MNINDLVTGRLYKCKNELHASDYEKNEDLAMFLRIYGKNVSVLTITGVYKLVPAEVLEIPERNYMELFDKNTVTRFSSIMKKFFNEYQKYDGVKYNEKTGFKAGKFDLVKLNKLKNELKSLDILPAISIAVENYFDTYKDFGITFSCLEDLIIDFAYIPEWEESFNELRGFDFSNKTISPKKIKKYTNEALIMHHLYTNLFIKPNLKNIRVEWLDLLLDKLNKHNTSLTLNKHIATTIESIKWQCVIENSKTETVPEVKSVSSSMHNPLNNTSYTNLTNSVANQINTIKSNQVNTKTANESISDFASQMNKIMSSSNESPLSGIEQLNSIANSKTSNKLPNGYTGINFSL